MASQDVRFVMAVDDQGFIRKMTEAEQALFDLQKTTGKATSAFDQLWKGFTVGQLAVDGIRKGFTALKGFLESSVTEALDAEQAQRRLATALDMTGRAGSQTLQTMLNFANAQQKVTLYTDEEIESVMTLFAQMTKLDTQGLQKVTKGVMGLATVMGTDLRGAATKVLQVMEGQSNSIRGTGIVIDDTLPKHEKMAQIMEKLISLYPRATAELEAMGGQISQIKKAWGELKETFGELMLEGSGLTVILPKINEALQKSGEGAEKAALQHGKMTEQFQGWTRSGGFGFQYFDRTRQAEQATQDLDVQIRAIASDFMAGLRPGIEASTVALQKITAATLDAKKAFKDMADLNLERLSPFGELMEDEPGGLFGEGKEFENPLQDMIDRWNSTAHGYTLILKGMTKSTQTETRKQADYFAGLYNDMARGFANVFMQFRLTTEGFKNFFIGMWQEIKRAFFTILAEMLARWLATAFVRFLMSAFAGPAMPLMTGTGGILPIPAQHGFQGVVNRPTLFLAGEAGPERVNISPTNRGGGGTTINITVQTLDAERFDSIVRYRIAPVLREIYAHGDL